MPWRGRMILHFLDDRGLDVELRRCGKCDRVFEGNQVCPGCGARGDLHKKRGELNSGSAKYTMEQIAMALGLHVSTVYSYFTMFKRIGILRTAPGTVWRKCQRCTNLPLYADKCAGCGSTSDPIKRRDAQLIIDLTSRTLDKQLAATERQRLENLVKWHRRWLDQKHQAELEAAVELATKVLGEWEGREHLLVSFHHEMRRRLAASKLRANLMNVLFPLQRE
jgi:RNA polymerase subunit RPABC4/transcription elongation factor Spt4